MNIKTNIVIDDKDYVKVSTREEYDIVVKFFESYIGESLYYKGNFQTKTVYSSGTKYLVLWTGEKSIACVGKIDHENCKEISMDSIKEYMKVKESLEINHLDYVRITSEEDFNIVINSFEKYIGKDSFKLNYLACRYTEGARYVRFETEDKVLVLFRYYYDSFNNEIPLERFKEFLDNNNNNNNISSEDEDKYKDLHRNRELLLKQLENVDMILDMNMSGDFVEDILKGSLKEYIDSWMSVDCEESFQLTKEDIETNHNKLKLLKSKIL